MGGPTQVGGISEAAQLVSNAADTINTPEGGEELIKFHDNHKARIFCLVLGAVIAAAMLAKTAARG